MRFSTTLDLAGGTGSYNGYQLHGGPPASVGPFGYYQGGSWLDDDRLLVQDTTLNQLVTFSRASGFTVETPFAGARCNVFRAGGGNWAATLFAGDFPSAGSFNGGPLPVQFQTQHQIVNVDRDGSMLWKDFNNHFWMLWSSTGQAVDVGLAYYAQVSNGACLVLSNPVKLWTALSSKVCQTVVSSGLNQPCPLNTEWLSYASAQTGRVCHRWDDASQGYRLTVGWSPDVLSSGGLYYPAVSAGEAEIATQYVRDAPIDLGVNMVPLEAFGSFRPSPLAIGVPYFYDHDEPYSISFVPPEPFAFRDISKGQPLTKRTDQIGLVYCDRFGLDPHAVPDGWFGALYAYPNDHGTILTADALRSRLLTDIAIFDGRGVPFAFVAATYTQSNGFTDKLSESLVRECLRVIWDLAIDFGAEFVCCFAKERADGVQAHPIFGVDVAQMRAASPNWRHVPAQIPPDPIPPEPPVTPIQKIALGMNGRFLTFDTVGNIPSGSPRLPTMSLNATTYTDPRAAIVPYIFDWAGEKGKWADKQKVECQSGQDGVFVFFDAVLALSNNLSRAGLLTIWADPNGWKLEIPGSSLYLTAGATLTFQPASAASGDQVWKTYNAATGQELVGPFK